MKRDVLANRHQYGESASLLEKEIEGFEPEFEVYETLKAEGNYQEAHTHIQGLDQDIAYLKEDMSEIPDLMREAQKNCLVNFKILNMAYVI